MCLISSTRRLYVVAIDLSVHLSVIFKNITFLVSEMTKWHKIIVALMPNRWSKSNFDFNKLNNIYQSTSHIYFYYYALTYLLIPAVHIPCSLSIQVLLKVTSFPFILSQVAMEIIFYKLAIWFYKILVFA